MTDPSLEAGTSPDPQESLRQWAADVRQEASLDDLAATNTALDAARAALTIGPFSWLVRQVVLWWNVIRRSAKRVAVAFAGVAVILVGVVLLVLPGPGVVVIGAGIAILATEFVWAERLLRAGHRRIAAVGSAIKKRAFGNGADS